ncbi:hypothetical protein Daus18300_004959 [Diaporthe australafricana]|uniref:Dynamin family protein n=1 Tax=Diaporthe australafricana TaxID=127596 RepID=A0ABR3X5C4_9PEZI
MGGSSPADVARDKEAIEQLNSPRAKLLLDTIDNLRELRVGEIVQLPQIIVVGDQSSGKSSVLEAVSGMKFPVHGDLCTRFATELILRRDPETKIAVSIQKATKMVAFGQDTAEQAESMPFHKTSFDKNALPEIINEAQERMGIRNGSKAFSKDILRVVVAGPDAPQLTLVDLPGIFHSATSDQTLQGKTIVDELIDKYMQESKSIILVVVAANNQLANQSVLTRAKLHDPSSRRIVGVITKPDLVDSSANEKKYLDLCRGLESAHKLPLGWHVLRNSSEQERNDANHDRDVEEQRFFQRSGWSSVSPANRGIESLRNKLSKVLFEHIRTSLPGLIREIENSLSAREEELKQLGKSRSTPEEMRSFLLGIADDFQRLARDAVEGRYGDRFFGDLSAYDRKLRARLRQMNHAFDSTMSSKGTTYNIECEIESDSDDISDDEIPAHLRRQIHEYQRQFPDPLPIKRSALTRQLEDLASLNQGKELPGTPNAELALQFFRKQAKPWKRIAEFHLVQVQDASKAFVDQLFQCVIGADNETIGAVLNGCADPFFDKKSALLVDKLQELLRPYTTGYGLPLEREFRAETSKRALLRNSQQLMEALKTERPDIFHPEAPAMDRETFLQSVVDTKSLSKGDFGTEQVIHMMVVHYEMSRRTFIENVINLAVENCLICDIPNILTPKKVNHMTEETLRDLVSESEEVLLKREVLQEQAKTLREGLRICQQHRRRDIAAPSTFARTDTPGKQRQMGSTSEQH